MSGTPAYRASSTAGCRFATAEPDVVTTAATCPASPEPRATKPATRSSVSTWSSTTPAASASASAYASGADRDPGHSTKRRTPWRTSSATISRAIRVDASTCSFTLALP